VSGAWRYAAITLANSNEIYPVFHKLPVTSEAETHSACYNADGKRHADGHATQSGKIRYQRQARPLAVTSGHDFRLFEHIADTGIEARADAQSGVCIAMAQGLVALVYADLQEGKS
jgi:hypothetical protein